MTTNPITVLLADDHSLVRRGFRRLLEDDAAIAVVGEASNGDEAIALAIQLKPHVAVFYDEKGAVGRRYRRQDEAGTPFCITIDGQTLQDQTVTVRDRDTLKQWRVKSADVVDEIARLVEG